MIWQFSNIEYSSNVHVQIPGCFKYCSTRAKNWRSKRDCFTDVLTLRFLPATGLQVKMSVDTVRPKESARRSCGLVPENLSNSRWWRAWPATLSSPTWPATPSLISLKLRWGQYWMPLHSHPCFNDGCNIRGCWDTSLSKPGLEDLPNRFLLFFSVSVWVLNLGCYLSWSTWATTQSNRLAAL